MYGQFVREMPETMDEKESSNGSHAVGRARTGNSNKLCETQDKQHNHHFVKYVTRKMKQYLIL